MASRLAAAVATTNPVTFLATLSTRGWCGVGVCALLTYCHWISTLSKRPRDTPCPEFGRVLRVLYGLFSTRLAEVVLGFFLHTKPGEQQAEQHGGTVKTLVGQPVEPAPGAGPAWTPHAEGETRPELRVEIIPVLGSFLGGNYAYLVWDEEDPQRRALVIDPADPLPVYNAARARGLDVQMLLCTHWHFDHSGGNRKFKRLLPSLQVFAGSGDQQTPCATRLVGDLEEWNLGRLRIRAHAVPGHTLGSTIYEVSSLVDSSIASAAFTGDTLFCGGCGALFEASAAVMYASFKRLRLRLRGDCQVFPGHEYTEMLLAMACKREPMNRNARLALARAQDKRAMSKATVPSTFADELEYNPHLRADERTLAALCGCA